MPGGDTTLFGPTEQITAEVLEWEGVTLSMNRSGVREFRVGRRGFGQIRNDSQIDILLSRPARIDYVVRGLAEPHPVLPRSGWVTVYLNSEFQERVAVQILHEAYDEACQHLRSSAGRAPLLQSVNAPSATLPARRPQ
jgi:hypothetical protein